MTTKNKVKFLYLTASSTTEAETISTKLVDEELVACANILGEVTAIHKWGGKLIKEKETVLILKTSAKLVEQTLKRISELHSYECPAAVVLDIQGGNIDFLAWINEVTDQNFRD